MNTKLKPIRNLAESDWMELAKQSKFTAELLAQRLKVSRWQLQRYTKRLFCQSPQRWLNDQRLILAAELLKNCSSIKKVALDLGFSDGSQFCHQFRRRYSRSPSEFVAEQIVCPAYCGRFEITGSLKRDLNASEVCVEPV